MAFRGAKNLSIEAQREKRRASAKRSALRALRRARDAAAENGAELSGWETEFLGSVEQRVDTYGRAFRDREKGAPGASLSNRQAGKLREITAKARGKAVRRP